MSRIGLVFAGGGGKGAYQIGVWRALQELKIDTNISAVSGTSVGALNAALFSQGVLETAQHVWEGLRPGQILILRSQADAKKLTSFLLKNRASGNAIAPEAISEQPHLRFSALAWAFRGLPWLPPFLVNSLTSGIISPSGLAKMIDTAIDFSVLSRSKIRCYATCCRLPLFRVDRYLLGDKAPDIARSILLASAAIPVVFPPVRVSRYFYYDGGCPKVGDNVPVFPVYHLAACKTILVIHLCEEPPTDRSLYPGADIIDIFPSQDLGGLSGTFDFTGDGARCRMDLGYRDAMSVLSAHPFLPHLVGF